MKLARSFNSVCRLVCVEEFYPLIYNVNKFFCGLKNYYHFASMEETLHIAPTNENPMTENPKIFDKKQLSNEKNSPFKELQLSGFKLETKGVKRKRSFTVAVEGNIGSGKSTFLKYFSKFPNVVTHQEPIGMWTNVSGNNLLQKLYENSNRWSFLFQSYVQLTRLAIHLQNSNSDVKIIERSFQNNRFCFTEIAFKAGNMCKEEYDVICAYYDFFEKNFDIDVDLIVYLRTTPEIVYERMKKRGRTEEKNVPLEYMKKVHEFYEKWLIDGNPRKPSVPIIIMNGDLNIKQVFEECEKQKDIIMGSSVGKKS